MMHETNSWSEERRRKQAERCRANRPWAHSTGPKSAAGKEASSQNALKHGARSEAFKTLRKALKENQKILEIISQDPASTKNDERTERHGCEHET